MACHRELNPVATNHPERTTNDLREKAENLNFDGIKFPVSLKDITKIEKNNPGIAMNVFLFDNINKTAYPLRISELSEREHEVNLLLLENFEKKHYFLSNICQGFCQAKLQNIIIKSFSA